MGKREIELRITFVKIGQVDTTNERYNADVFILAKWREPLLDKKVDLDDQDDLGITATDVDVTKLWNPELKVENVISSTSDTASHEVVYLGEGKDEAYVTEKRRIKGTFLEILELNHFPFDCQDLSVTIASQKPASEVELVEAKEEMSHVNSQTDSQEWELHYHVEVECKELHGDANVGPKIRSAICFTTRVSRKYNYFLINNVLISACITILAFFAFAVTRDNVFGRIQLSFILLLTTVTFKSAASQNLPKVPYLTYLDKLILGNMCMIFLNCVWHAIASKIDLSATNVDKYEPFVILALGTVYITFLMTYGISIYFDAFARRREMLKKDQEYHSRVKELQANHHDGSPQLNHCEPNDTAAYPPLPDN